MNCPRREQFRLLLSELWTFDTPGTAERQRKLCFSRSLLSTEPIN